MTVKLPSHPRLRQRFANSTVVSSSSPKGTPFFTPIGSNRCPLDPDRHTTASRFFLQSSLVLTHEKATPLHPNTEIQLSNGH
ncbi:hypothetical protein BJ508DRAFT_411796 [Ascobolus immersus RN42]|uniref:Uncharacterized protein n=1 Tax=Ascobolus immersus RN42 TaxID=1160509 RepID=A0A3N4IJK9_ASCIM|nr:hypothetical protein BJ508DRAFT_411796 [Ascobolus immersus RN42]